MADGELGGRIAAMVVLLLLSAFFSGSETAFLSLNSLEKDALRRRVKGRTASFVGVLFTRPDEVLVTILTGNMFVNVFATSISEAIGDHLFRESAEIVSIAAMTIILLVIGEMTPKNVAIRHSLSFSSFAVRFLSVFFIVAKPVTAPLSRLRHIILSAFRGGAGDGEDGRSAAVLSAIRMGFQSGTIQSSELHLLESFFRLKDKTAADVMMPRIDLHSVDGSSTIGELIAALKSGEINPRHRLVAVHKSDVDHIAGYIRTRDLVAYRLKNDIDGRISGLVRPIHAVPDGKALREVMDELHELNAEMAVVVDEYGGTEGVITYHTIVEHLFEAFHPDYERLLEATGPDSYRLSGALEIGSLEDALDVAFDTSSRTVSGMVIDHLGDLPHVGAEVEIEKHLFRVAAVNERRITWLEVSKAP